jgi:hypothetical protein
MNLTKRKPYRNKAILKAAEDEACTICDIQDGTVVFAHFNESWAGKGYGQKADDCAGMFLCLYHHHQYDNPDPWQHKLADWIILRAYYRTIRRLFDKGVLQ